MFRAGELETDINSKIIITIGIVNSCLESIGSEDLIVSGSKDGGCRIGFLCRAVVKDFPAEKLGCIFGRRDSRCTYLCKGKNCEKEGEKRAESSLRH